MVQADVVNPSSESDMVPLMASDRENEFRHEFKRRLRQAREQRFPHKRQMRDHIAQRLDPDTWRVDPTGARPVQETYNRWEHPNGPLPPIRDWDYYERIADVAGFELPAHPWGGPEAAVEIREEEDRLARMERKLDEAIHFLRKLS